MGKICAIAVVLLIGMLGCDRAVEVNEITGTWVITNNSRHLLATVQQNASARVLLERNGAFVASELPEDLLYGPPQVAGGLVAGSGHWKLTSRNGEQQVQLDFNVISSGQRRQLPYGTQLNVAKRGSSVSLFYFQGDADQGRKIEFSKQ